jgi:hypothetical protein
VQVPEFYFPFLSCHFHVNIIIVIIIIITAKSSIFFPNPAVEDSASYILLKRPHSVFTSFNSAAVFFCQAKEASKQTLEEQPSVLMSSSI